MNLIPNVFVSALLNLSERGRTERGEPSLHRKSERRHRDRHGRGRRGPEHRQDRKIVSRSFATYARRIQVVLY